MFSCRTAWCWGWWGSGVFTSELDGIIGSKLTDFFALNLYPLQLTQGIFTKIIQEIAHVENSSYGQEHRCHLMGALRHGVAV